METQAVGNTPQPRTWLGVLGVVIALSPPVFQVLLGPWFYDMVGFPMDRFFSLLVFWVALALVLAIARYGEGYPLSLFGYARTQKTLRARLIEWILAALAALVLGIVVISFSNYVRMALTGEPAPVLAAVRKFPAWVLIPAWVTGSFVEEALYRGYAIERLTLLTGKRWLAALITLLTFTVLHIFGWDWIHVLTAVLPGGLMLTLFYLWRRSLAFNVIVHGILNAPLLLLPLLEPFM